MEIFRFWAKAVRMTYNAYKILPLLAFLVCSFSLAPGNAAQLKVAVNSDWPPFSHGTGKTAQGILPDLMKEIVTNKMGIDVVNVGYPWARTQRMVETGQLDAMITVPTAGRLKYANSSEELVYTVEMRSVAKRGSAAEKKLLESPAAESLQSFRYCDIRGNGWGKRFTEKYQITPLIASKVSSCLRMVSKNRVDVTLQSSAVAMLEIAAAKLDKELAVLPTVYGKMEFTLLLSKKSGLGRGFLKRFDETVKSMKADGSYDALIKRLRSGG